MTLFLTSSPGNFYIENGRRVPCPMDSRNGFVIEIKKVWPANAKCLIISADPDSAPRNDGMRELFSQSFAMTGLSVRELVTWDHRNTDALPCPLSGFDVVILSGGHVPTQNAFFQEINLKERITSFPGIVIGISAGTMNSAETVYAQPELEGESIDPGYQRFIPGLGLTDLMILPHYQSVKDDILDGKRVMEDITYPDSIGRRFYALEDGSYILASGSTKRLYGTAYEISEGKIRQICAGGQTLDLP